MGSKKMLARTILTILCVIFLQGCASSQWNASRWLNDQSDKIHFDLDSLNNDGLRGQMDGLTTLSYEFCIPDNIDSVDQVMAIDPTLVVYKHASGRVQCDDKQYLAIGHTGQRDFRNILNKLADLEYVTNIQEALFE